MAKATVVRKITDVNLRLDEKEMNFLIQVLANVGGPPEGPRGLGDGIAEALRLVGGEYADYRVDKDAAGKGSIYFPNQER